MLNGRKVLRGGNYECPDLVNDLNNCFEYERRFILKCRRKLKCFWRNVEERPPQLRLLAPRSDAASDGETFTRYPRAVLIGLRAIRKTLEEGDRMPVTMRIELAKALHLTAAYIDLQTQIDAVDD